MQRLTLYLPPGEMELLRAMSEAECRLPEQQLRFLFQREARERGFLDKREGSGHSPESNAATLTQKHPNGASPSIGGSHASIP